MCATGECHNCSVLADIDAEMTVSEAHVECLMCDAEGCTGCPSAFCDRPRLVEHANEWMCAKCVSTFEGYTDNAAIPLVVDEEETTPIDREPMALVVGARLR